MVVFPLITSLNTIASSTALCAIVASAPKVVGGMIPDSSATTSPAETAVITPLPATSITVSIINSLSLITAPIPSSEAFI